ncbi:MAG: hypothetical protein ACJAUG_002319 [Halioglobus sp.]|jgi:hypothetical protein
MMVMCAALSLSAEAIEGPEWTLDKEGDRIALYTSEVEGSPFLAVKVTATIQASMEKVLMVLGDGNGCSAWRAMCKSSEIVKKVSDQEHYIYMVLDLPWPISDRDLVMHSVAQTDADAKSVTVILNTASDDHPEQKFVRAESNGHYTLTATGDDLVEFTWTMHTDLRGKLSPGIINPQLTSSTLKDVKSLMELSES